MPRALKWSLGGGAVSYETFGRVGVPTRRGAQVQKGGTPIKPQGQVWMCRQKLTPCPPDHDLVMKRNVRGKFFWSPDAYTEAVSRMALSIVLVSL